MPDVVVCPQCGSSEIQFRNSRSDWICDSCGHTSQPGEMASHLPSHVTTVPTASHRSIFLSYGRADGLDFTKQLARDLETRGGYQVWMDLEAIEKGGLFEVRIEQGIRSASVVMAVMTRHSLREESVCRDEVVFALNEGKPVVPLRVETDPNVKPTLLLARRNWVDFAENYEEGLSTLLRYLQGNEKALAPPLLPLVSGLVPLDFGPEIARFSDGFTGRTWLVQELDEWLSNTQKNAFVIIGEPGIGKSAIAAWLSDQYRDRVVGIHFCQQSRKRTLDPHEFVANLVGQLSTQLAEFARLVAARQPENRRVTASDAFRELVVEPALQMKDATGSRLFIVDSLDEAATFQGDETIVETLVNHAEYLPDWLRIIATTRPEEPILRCIRTLNPHELKADRPENLDDVGAYIRSQSHRIGMDGDRLQGLIRRLETLAAGNFLYAKMALEALHDGSLSGEDLGQLAPGLSDFYRKVFHRRFPDAETFGRDFRPFLKALSVALGPIPFKLLARASGVSAEDLQRRLSVLRCYLRVAGKGDEAQYSLFHKSLRDWLLDRDASGDFWCEPTSGHASLADLLSANWEGNEYALRYLPAHLVATQRWEQLADLLTDILFLEAKIQAGMAFDLATDLSTAIAQLPDNHLTLPILRLLERSLGREIHFLVRRGTDYAPILYQCLWNTWSWHESPETAGYYQPRRRSVQTRSPEAGQDASATSRQLGRWQDIWTTANPDACWLRSLRPPKVPLNSAQVAVLRGHRSPIQAVAASKDGKRIATGSLGGSVRIWDVASGRELLAIRSHRHPVNSICFSPDGARIAVGSDDKTVRVWDAIAGEEQAVLAGHTKRVRCVSFANDGVRLVSGSDDATLRVWDTFKKRSVAMIWGHEAAVTSVGFSPDDEQIASCSWDCSVRVWNASTGEQLFSLQGHTDRVTCLSFSNDGMQIASGSSDKTVRVWNVQRSQSPVVLYGHDWIVASVAFSPDDASLASAGENDNTVRLWNPVTGTSLGVLQGHDQDVTGVCFLGATGRIVSSSNDATVRIWDAASEMDRPVMTGHDGLVRCITFSPDGKRLATASDDKTVRIWNGTTGHPLHALPGHSDWVTSVSFAPDGKRLASVSRDRTIRLWDADNGRLLSILARQGSELQGVVFSPDGKRLATAGRDGTARIWDVASGEPLLVTRGSHSLTSVAFSPDGKSLAAAAEDGCVYVWDASQGRELAVCSGHKRRTTRVAFSPDGTRLASTSTDRTVRVWEAGTARCLTVLEGTGDVTAITAGSEAFPLCMLVHKKETIVEDVRTGQAVAYWPGALFHVATHPTGRIWAGADGSHFHLLKLENGTERRERA